jgi:hypothetical protein
MCGNCKTTDAAIHVIFRATAAVDYPASYKSTENMGPGAKGLTDRKLGRA